MTRFVLDRAVRLAGDYGYEGVLVDTKPGSVGFYQELGFLELEPVAGQISARPVATSLILPLQEILSSRRR